MKITTVDLRRGTMRFLRRVLETERDPKKCRQAFELVNRRMRRQEACDRAAAREEAWYDKATQERTQRLYQQQALTG